MNFRNHKNHRATLFRSSTLIVAIFLLVIIGMIINSHNFMMQSIQNSKHEQVMAIKAQLREEFHEELQDPYQTAINKKYLTHSKPKLSKEEEEFYNQECFRARKNTIPPSMYGKIPLPYINLGFPKMGTTSLHGFFGCGGYRSVHYRCNATTSCGDCMKYQASQFYDKKYNEIGSDEDSPFRPPPPTLKKCGTSDMYAQIDNGMYFTQIELLEELIQYHPNATFFLTFRPMEKWWKSLKNWPPSEPIRKMNNILRNINITGLPPGKGRDLREMSEWFCWHVTRVRKLLDNDPNHALVEVDIEDPGISRYMQDLFAIHGDCWGHANVNAQLHPEMKGAKDGGDLPWLIRGKVVKGGGLILNASDENTSKFSG